MKFSKRLLSLFLAVVMLASVFTVMASAYTRVPTEGTADIDVKYTVEKVPTVPATDAGSFEYTADNIYAVTVWMKSAKPVDTLVVPYHFNKAHFAPIMLVDDMGLTYPTGAGFGVDNYYANMSEGILYAYSLGDYMNNTGMYKANGDTATTKALAKCIGIGSSQAKPIKITSELVSPDHPLYYKWGAGLLSDTGVLYAKIDVATNEKTAYLNTISGITTDTGWNRMFTVYFETLPGVTDADVIGDEFGVFIDSEDNTLDGDYDGVGLGYFQGATNYDPLRPTMNCVSNAVITAPASPVKEKSAQIRFNGTETAGTGSANFDVRTRAYISKADLATILGVAEADVETAAKAAGANLQVGFVYQATSAGAFNIDAAKAAATAGATTGTYFVKPVTYVQRSGSDYVWTCLITGADYADGVDSLAYINYNGTMYFLDAPASANFGSLYGTYYPQYVASLS